MSRNRLLQAGSGYILLALLLAACGPGANERLALAEQVEGAAKTATPATASPHSQPTTSIPKSPTSEAPTRPFVVDPTATGVFLENDYEEYEIITVLAQDAIPAIDNPQFLTVEEADGLYSPDEEVIGVAFNGEARAYSIPLLSRHEIVNDVVGGVALAVTW